MTKLSVLIPTYNRPESLRETLSNVSSQSYRDCEIVIVDDGSRRELTESVCAAFGARYFRVQTNEGVVAAQNLGIEKCVSPYILSLDDDSWPVPSDSLRDCVEFMDDNPSIAILALNIQVRDRPPQWPANLPPFRVPYYAGCGAVFRRSMVLQTGGNIREFQRQGEESDRSLRVHSAGLPIVAFPRIIVHHEVSELNRNRRRHVTLEALNYLSRELVRAPLLLMPYGAVRALAFATHHRRSLDVTEYLKGLCDATMGPFRLMVKYRQPVPIRKYLQWQVQRHFYNDSRMSLERFARRYAWVAPRHI